MEENIIMDPFCPTVDYSYPVQFPQEQQQYDFFAIPDPSVPLEEPKLHAPVPLQGQSPLLYSEFPSPSVYSTNSSLNDPQQITAPGLTICDPIQAPVASSPLSIVSDAQTVVHGAFPTPSELLADISSSGDGLPSSSASDDFASDLRSETARKARRRAMAESVGFVPTDPDTISSHDKKRHYLECIEQYIQYLHEQFDRVGETPPAIERVTAYRGLSNKSIRTLLVHMEHRTREMNALTVSEEDRFLNLRNDVYAKEGIQPLTRFEDA